MFDCYISILRFVIVGMSLLVGLGVVYAWAWVQSNKLLEKERYSNSLLHSKVKSQVNEIETLRAKNNFLLNCIKEKDESLRRALAAVRDKVDTEV